MAAEMRWTNSMLSMLEVCGEKFRLRYIEKILMPPSPRQVRGTATHRSVRFSMKRRMDAGLLPALEEVKDNAASEFDMQWLSGVLLSEEDKAEGMATVRDRAKDMAVNLSGLHRTAVAPGIVPKGVEYRIDVKPKDSDITIAGTLDLLADQGGLDWIRDTKTGEKSPNGDAAERSQQLTMYGLIRLAEVGALPAGYQQDHLVQTPARRDLKYVPLKTSRDMEDMRLLVNRINTATESVRRGSFVPCPPDHWACSATWCDYFNNGCIYTTRGVSRPTS